MISGFPPSETDATAGSACGSPPCFLLDRTLGRLARWLRLVGYDAEWDPTDDAVRLLTRAEAEDRTLLTRDTLLVQRRAVHRGSVTALLVRGDHLEEQLHQLGEELDLRQRPRARCLVCNGPLRRRSADEARGRVPPYVANTQDLFSYCPVCGRFTWRATHWEGMMSMLRKAGVYEA